MMIYLENVFKSPCHGGLVFASEGRYGDSRHQTSENRKLLFKSLQEQGHSFICIAWLDVYSVKATLLGAAGHTKMEKPQVPVLRSFRFPWRDNRHTQIATIYQRLKVVSREK